jgi:hypothetical protein
MVMVGLKWLPPSTTSELRFPSQYRSKYASGPRIALEPVLSFPSDLDKVGVGVTMMLITDATWGRKGYYQM